MLRFGAAAVLVEVDGIEAVHRLWRALRTDPPEGMEEAVAGARTVLVRMSGDDFEPRDLEAAVARLDVTAAAPPPRTVTIPVAYDGPDLDDVARAADVTPAEVPRLHSAPTYTVGFLGFSPGFAYLLGGDPRLAVPRLDTPRTSVPAGSVALAGGMTAVYPQATPGGWRQIGRTDAVMFDPGRDEPALLSPGDLVRFRPAPVPAARPFRPPGLRAVAPGVPSLQVVDPGPLLTVQDGGRKGWAHVGVPVAGAADRRSAERANLLVGNPAGAALLECTLGSCRLRLQADRSVAVTGAVSDVTVDGLPGRRDVALSLRAGSEVTIGPCRAGLRVYVAISGGLDVEEVMGSRSTDTLSGLGPPRLRAGDVIALGAPAAAPAPAGGAPGPLPSPAPPAGAPQAVLEVAAIRGPRADRLNAPGWEALVGTEFVVGASSDRTGVRLEGPALTVSDGGRLASEGMIAGAVQLPPDGQPIVLMRNHPPTGGYPVVAVIDDAGIDTLAQARPGQRVRLVL